MLQNYAGREAELWEKLQGKYGKQEAPKEDKEGKSKEGKNKEGKSSAAADDTSTLYGKELRKRSTCPKCGKEIVPRLDLACTIMLTPSAMSSSK